MHPRDADGAQFLAGMKTSLRRSRHVIRFALAPGDFFVGDNTLWLHGRDPLRRHPELRRLLVTVHGRFGN